MTEVIHERVRSRGRVRCEECGRRVPEEERYTRMTFTDRGSVCHILECAPCAAVAPNLARWLYECGHEGDWEPSDAYEWAEAAMGYSSEFADLVMPDGPHSASDEADRISAVKNAQRYPETDYEPGWAWDDEAWAAFTWRMQISPVFNARRKW